MTLLPPMAGGDVPRFAVTGGELRTATRQLTRAPRAELAALVMNAAIVIGGWFILPQGLRQWLFGFEGPISFVIILQTWMMGDVVFTNVLTLDRELQAAIDDPAAFARRLRSASMAKGLVVGVLSVVVAAVISIDLGPRVTDVFVVLAAFVAPAGVLPLVAFVGVAFPLHLQTLKWRYQHRRPWRNTVRWLILRYCPYTVVGAVMAIFLTPAVILGAAVGGRDHSHHLTANATAVAALVVSVLAVVSVAISPELVAWFAARRGSRLRDYIIDTSRA